MSIAPHMLCFIAAALSTAALSTAAAARLTIEHDATMRNAPFLRYDETRKFEPQSRITGHVGPRLQQATTLRGEVPRVRQWSRPPDTRHRGHRRHPCTHILSRRCQPMASFGRPSQNCAARDSQAESASRSLAECLDLHGGSLSANCFVVRVLRADANRVQRSNESCVIDLKEME